MVISVMDTYCGSSLCEPLSGFPEEAKLLPFEGKSFKLP